jgi:hypothetical protein
MTFGDGYACCGLSLCCTEIIFQIPGVVAKTAYPVRLAEIRFGDEGTGILLLSNMHYINTDACIIIYILCIVSGCCWTLTLVNSPHVDRP